MLKTHIIPVALFFSVFSLFSCLDEFADGNSLQPEEEKGYKDVDPDYGITTISSRKKPKLEG